MDSDVSGTFHECFIVIGAAVMSCGGVLDVHSEDGILCCCSTSCVDTDVSFALEEIGELPRLSNEGCTYVRGYDRYTVTSSGVVCSSVYSIDESCGEACSAP